MNKKFLAFIILSLIFIFFWYKACEQRNNEVAEKDRVELEQKKQKYIADSISSVKKIQEQANNVERKLQAEKRVNLERIDGYTTGSKEKFDIVVVVVDSKNNSVNSVSSKIAAKLRERGYSVTNSYFTNSFLQSDHFHDLESGSSKVVDMLSIRDRVRNVFIGRYSEVMEETIVEGEKAFICRVFLNIKIISCQKNVQIYGDEKPASNNAYDEINAKVGAVQKLVNRLNPEEFTFE